MSEREEEIILLRRGELFEFLGRVSMPPPEICPSKTCATIELDCAEIADRLISWVEEHRIR